MREDGKLKGKKRRVTRKDCRRLREEIEEEVHGTSPRGECWKTDEHCPGKTETCSGKTKPRTKLREDVEGKEEEREWWSKEAKEEESKREKREVEEERESAEIRGKRICPNRLSGKVFEVLEVESEVVFL